MHLGEQKGTAIDLPPLGPGAALCNPLTSTLFSLSLLSTGFLLCGRYTYGDNVAFSCPFSRALLYPTTVPMFSLSPSAVSFILRTGCFFWPNGRQARTVRLAFGWLYSNVARFHRNPFPAIEKISCSIIRHSLPSTP